MTLLKLEVSVLKIDPQNICIHSKMPLRSGTRRTAAGHGDGHQNTIMVSQMFLDTDPVLYGDCPRM